MIVELPENPTREILLLFKPDNFEEIIQIAREEQQKLGFDIVPPNYEIEQASAIYRMLYNHLKKKQNETR